MVQGRTLIAVYAVAEGLAGALWLAGAAAPAPARYACWAVAVAAEAAAPIMATTRSAGLPLHFEHLPERFGLLVILVLGESIAAIAVGVHETHWEPVTVTVAALGFVVAVSLWWTYFDLAGQQPRTSWPIVAATAAPCCTTSTPTGIGRSPWGWPRQGSVSKTASWKAARRVSRRGPAGSCAVVWPCTCLP